MPFEWVVWKIAFALSALGSYVRGREDLFCKENLELAREALKAQRARDRVGNIYHVTNSMRKPAADKEYYVVGLTNRVEDATDPIIFMFTDNELIRAEKRAQKNTEDIPADLSDPFYGTDNS